VPGLALGHAASYVVATAAGLVLLRSKLGSLDGRRVGRTIGRAVPAAAASALAAWLVAVGVAEVGDTNLVLWRLVQVGLAVAAGVGTYLAAALMSGIEEVDEVVGAVRRRFR
jgi:putative peptidoglycan lipid II flippase